MTNDVNFQYIYITWAFALQAFGSAKPYGSTRSIVRRIATSLPLKPCPRVHFQVSDELQDHHLIVLVWYDRQARLTLTKFFMITTCCYSLTQYPPLFLSVCLYCSSHRHVTTTHVPSSIFVYICLSDCFHLWTINRVDEVIRTVIVPAMTQRERLDLEQVSVKYFSSVHIFSKTLLLFFTFLSLWTLLSLFFFSSVSSHPPLLWGMQYVCFRSVCWATCDNTMLIKDLLSYLNLSLTTCPSPHILLFKHLHFFFITSLY